MVNRWFPENQFSGQNPPSALAEGSSNRPPPFPPDPPDQNLISSLSDFPPLSPISPSALSQHSPQTAYIEPERVVLALPAHHKSTPVVVNAQAQAILNSYNKSLGENPRSGNRATVTPPKTAAQTDGLLTIPPPKVTRLFINPFQAANPQLLGPNCTKETLPPTRTQSVGAGPVAFENALNVRSQVDVPVSEATSAPAVVEKIVSAPQTIPTPPPPNQATNTLAQKLKKDADRSLKRLAPVDYSPEGKPRVVIPDSVFQEGAEIHKDFIIGRFKGMLPTFRHIQSVLSHMWGRGQKLEVHLNHTNNSMLVRLPNEFIRKKVLEKKLWYIGECMFLVAQWDSSGGSTTDMDAIPIWAHLKGMPFDLMHHKGISLVAGLVGEPKEMDEFTRNLVSLSVAHVKVERNLSKPLPSSVEVVRDSGEVITIDVEYPWIPPTCSHCKELGHVIRFCPSVTPSWFQ